MFGWEEAYFGFSLDDFNKACSALENNGIVYKSKRFTRSRSMLSVGMPRGRTAPVGLNPEWAHQYKLLVRNEDIEEARYHVNRALRG